MRHEPGMDEVMHPGSRDPDFAHAPSGWTKEDVEKIAAQEGLSLGEDHWRTVRALQEYYERVGLEEVNVRDLHDALEEKFHDKGGIKYLYGIFPGGPVAQGCRLAGLTPPSGTRDQGVGSVA